MRFISSKRYTKTPFKKKLTKAQRLWLDARLAQEKLLKVKQSQSVLKWSECGKTRSIIVEEE